MWSLILGRAYVEERIDSQRESIALGTPELKSELAELADGQPVLLIEPGSLRASGHIVRYATYGKTYVYGVIDGPIEYDE